MRKRPLRAACAVLVLTATLTACDSTRTVHAPEQPSPTIVRNAAGEAGGSAILYVVRRGWHIDIGFDARELSAPLGALAGNFPGVRFLLFGFGDRHYLESRHRQLPNLAAALWPGAGLILVTALAATPEQAFDSQQVIRVPVRAEQLRAAQAWLWQSLLRQDDGSLHTEGPGPYAGSLYLGTKARYSAAHTCNTWAAEMLKAAGLPIRSRGVLFAGQLWRQLQRRDARAYAAD